MADSEIPETEAPGPETSGQDQERQEARVEPEREKKKSAAAASKVEVRLQAAGDAPIMKQRNYNVDRDKQISWIIAFIRKYLKFQAHESLYLYVNQAFSPSPDQTVGNLADCFAQDNKLVLYYSRGQAWG